MGESSGPRRVLVVDDDPMLGRLLLRYLSRAGVPADLALSATEARTVFLAGVYSHAVVDLTLPDGSGADWLAAALLEDMNLFGILSSGYPVSTEFLPPELRLRATTLQKPFSPPDLLRALGHAETD